MKFDLADRGMLKAYLNSWPRTDAEAVALQEEWRRRVELIPLAGPVRLMGEGVEPDLAAGSYNALIWKGKQVGLILRTPKGIIPL